jgi:hypothetical protein
LKDRKHKGSKRRNKDMQNATNKAKKLKANNQQQKKTPTHTQNQTNKSKKPGVSYEISMSNVNNYINIKIK